MDYSSTLKLLVRARICSQIRQDMLILNCRYLDFKELARNIQQLRDEGTSDQLIQLHLDKLYMHGSRFVAKAGHFLNDYNRTFKGTSLNFAGKSVVDEVRAVMAQFGVQMLEYQKMKQEAGEDLLKLNEDVNNWE
jgi:hypothetical protein